MHPGAKLIHKSSNNSGTPYQIENYVGLRIKSNRLITNQISGKRTASQLSGDAWRDPSGDAAASENCHADGNLADDYDSTRTPARSRGAMTTSEITDAVLLMYHSSFLAIMAALYLCILFAQDFSHDVN